MSLTHNCPTTFVKYLGLFSWSYRHFKKQSHIFGALPDLALLTKELHFEIRMTVRFGNPQCKTRALCVGVSTCKLLCGCLSLYHYTSFVHQVIQTLLTFSSFTIYASTKIVSSYRTILYEHLGRLSNIA